MTGLQPNETQFLNDNQNIKKHYEYGWHTMLSTEQHCTAHPEDVLMDANRLS